MQVIISHPGLQYSYRLATVLNERGWLQAFMSGIPVIDSSTGAQQEFWGGLGNGIRKIPVGPSKRTHFPFFPLARRIVTALFDGDRALRASHRLDHAFDRWVANRIAKRRPHVVVCYENSALRTFTAAREVGAVCVLDAASVHHTAAGTWGESFLPRSAPWIDRQKDEEIELAHLVITCSDLARQTYIDAGVDASKVVAVNLGTTLPSNPAVERSIGEDCRFVFCGSATRRKGFDILLETFAEFGGEEVPAKLVVIGGGGDKDLDALARTMGNVVMLPFMQQSELFAEISRHDCLVLPSRFDSFGMVVPEAMAVGLPAVVSDRVGAKSILDAHPESGWIVECSKASLKSRLSWIVANKEARLRASNAARLAARDFTWERYGENVTAAIERAYLQMRGATT